MISTNGSAKQTAASRETEHPPRSVLLSVVLSALLAFWTPVLAGGLPLPAGTKVRVSVVNWSPTESRYQKWDAISGDFTVSEQGTFRFPIIGLVSATQSDGDRLGDEIAKRLQSTTGLVSAPEVIVEVLEYAPVYVLGSVANPGEYKFRPGMTVLQAYALGGGPERAEGTDGQVRLLADLKDANLATGLVKAKIARLEAELDGARAVDYSVGSDAGVTAREDMIFQARGKELARQVASLNELRDLLGQEIKVLEQKQQASDDAIAMTEKELKAVTALVQKGVVVTSRQSDLERELSSLRSEKLDQITAMMRARQSIAEATRNIDGLRDRQRTEVATTLQAERASLQGTEIKREMTEELLLQFLSADKIARDSSGEKALVFSIARMTDGSLTEIEATESTRLVPGDVVTVKSAEGGIDPRATGLVPSAGSSMSDVAVR